MPGVTACQMFVKPVPVLCGPDPALIQKIKIDPKGRTVGDLDTSHRNLVDQIRADNARKDKMLQEIDRCKER